MRSKGKSRRSFASAAVASISIAGGCWSARREHRSTWKELEAPILEWIEARAIPLDTVQPAAPDDDLVPVGELVGDARLVALGEATHGTEEFFLLKHRLIAYLVEREGFRVLAIEDDFALVEELDRFVQGEDVALDEAMEPLHPVWRCQALRDLFQWIKAYNESAAPDRRVRVFGFDAYDAPASARWLVAFLREVDPEAVATAEAQMARAREVYAHRWDLEYAKAAAEDVEALLVGLEERKEPYIERVGLARWQLALHHARHIQQVIDVVNVRRRDWHMARNLSWALDHHGEDARIVAWAHNGHVAAHAGLNPNKLPLAQRPMGYHLRRELGYRYFGIGLVFDHGGFRAAWAPTLFSRRDPGTNEFWVEPAPAGTFEAMLAEAAMPLYVLDLRGIPVGEAPETWALGPSYARTIGASFNPRANRKLGWFSSWQFTIPAEAYDAVAFVASTSPSRGCGSQEAIR